MIASDAPDEQLRLALAYYIAAMTDHLSGSIQPIEADAYAGRATTSKRVVST